MTTRLGDLIPRATLLASIRETLAANLRLWVNVTFPTIAPRPSSLDLLGLVDELADLLARHEVTALVLTELPEPEPRRLAPGVPSMAAACAAVCSAIAGLNAGDQRKIVDAAMILAAPPKATGMEIQRMYRDAPEVEDRGLRLSVADRNRMLDGAPVARAQPRERTLTEQLADLEVLARQLGYIVVRDSEVHDPGEVTLCDEGGSHTYTGTPAECTDWLDGICPGCRKRVATATEVDDNGYHPECLARVKGAMELAPPMSPPGPMVQVPSGPITDGQTVAINLGPQTTKD